MTQEEKRLFGIDKLNVPRSEIPAVTHIDYSARVQTVHEDTNPRYHALLSAFERKTGCPVLVNTGFNVRGEPIVCTPEDAFRCFMGNELDVLAVGNCYLRKEAQNPALRRNYETAFEPDDLYDREKNIFLFGLDSPPVLDNGGSFSPVTGFESTVHPLGVIRESGSTLSTQC